MQRPGPLRDMSLERFLAEANGIEIGLKPPGSNKRPLPPGGASLSGSKRRLLDVAADIIPTRSATSSTASSQPPLRGLKGSSQRPNLRSVRVQVFTRNRGSLDSPSGHKASGTRSTKSRCTSAPPCPMPSRDIIDENGERMRTSSAPMELDETPSPFSPTLGPCVEYYDDHYPGFDVHPDPVDAIIGPFHNFWFIGSIPSGGAEANKENLAPRLSGITALDSSEAQSLWSKAELRSPEQLDGKDGDTCISTSITPLAQKLSGTSLAQHTSMTPGSKDVRPSRAARPSLLISPTSEHTSLDTPMPLHRMRSLTDEEDGMDWFNDK